MHKKVIPIFCFQVSNLLSKAPSKIVIPRGNEEPLGQKPFLPLLLPPTSATRFRETATCRGNATRLG